MRRPQRGERMEKQRQDSKKLRKRKKDESKEERAGVKIKYVTWRE